MKIKIIVLYYLLLIKKAGKYDNFNSELRIFIGKISGI